MATPNATLQTLMDMEFLIGQIRKDMLDNKVAEYQTGLGSLKTKVDAAKTTADTKTQVAGNDLFTLS